MRDQPTPHFVGLDIGTSKVRCIVGMLDPEDQTKLSIIGHGSAANIGMRRGVIAHIDDVVDAIGQVLTEAERVSGVHINHATININGQHVSGINSKGVVAISAANREIGVEDRLRVEEAATVVQLPPNREIIQVFAKNYHVDGQDNIKDPVGMQGVRLEVDTHIVTAATPNIRSLHFALEKARIKASHLTVSSLASAEAVLNRQQKESGTLLLDIGAGTTNMVVVEDGEIQHVAVLPIGSIYLTNDLAIGLKTDLDVAEQVKIQHAAVADKAKTGVIKVTINKKEHKFDAADVQMITEARVEELFDYVDKELKKIRKSQRLPGGVVIVGGMAKLPGIEAFAREKLQLATRLGTLEPIGGLVDTVSDPTYTTAIGLMMLDMLLLPGSGEAQKASNEKVFGAIEGVWKRLKRKVNT